MASSSADRSLDTNTRATRIGYRIRQGTVAMTPNELKTKVDELSTVVADRLKTLEGQPQWGSEVARGDLIDALDELALQIDAMTELLAASD
jgi:hypothetical protein